MKRMQLRSTYDKVPNGKWACDGQKKTSDQLFYQISSVFVRLLENLFFFFFPLSKEQLWKLKIQVNNFISWKHTKVAQIMTNVKKEEQEVKKNWIKDNAEEIKT